MHAHMHKLTPEVRTTLWNLSKTGLLATVASMQLKWRAEFDMVGERSSNGSMIRLNPEKQKQPTTVIYNNKQTKILMVSYMGTE